MSDPAAPVFALSTSRGFPAWLGSLGASLAFTTYQAGKLLFLGLKPDGTLSVFERSFPRAMGLGVSPDGRMLMLATQVQVFRFDNILPPGAGATITCLVVTATTTCAAVRATTGCAAAPGMTCWQT
jgi:hypothetical protein